MSLVEVAQVPTQGLEIRPSRHLAPERAKICAEERKKKKNKFHKKILFVASSVVTTWLRFLFLFFGNIATPPAECLYFFPFYRLRVWRTGFILRHSFKGPAWRILKEAQ